MLPIALLDFAERQRVGALGLLNADTQGQLGQFFTPAPAAALIASMIRLPEAGTLRMLDPGAGSGVLSAAVVERVLRERPDLTIDILAVERDSAVVPHLGATLHACEVAGAGKVSVRVIEADFILDSIGMAAPLEALGDFDLVVENPPYGKLAVSSPHRQAMRAAGIDAPNLYAAFLSLSASMLRPGGQLVAITPRSFFNGPYFGPFRKHLLSRLALDRVHVFESRSTVFADAGVLQENVIFAGTVDGSRDAVELSVSLNHQDDLARRTVPYCEVVQPADPHAFIRLTTAAADTEAAELMLALPCSLADIDVQVSTGRVVDFRSRDALLQSPMTGSVPLIYPGNLRDSSVEWPRSIRKPQWFSPHAPRDESLLVPEGWYAVVKRFSAKEERRRIVAGVWSPLDHPGPVAFENHLNVFHSRGQGLDETLARGIAVWLNSSLVDRFFRTFSGHTQVNATDLRTLRFPLPDVLRDLGRVAVTEQTAIDALIMDRIAA